MAQVSASPHKPHQYPPTDDELAQQPGDPELLFPPGRLLWMFPSDEDLTSLGGGEEPPATANNKDRHQRRADDIDLETAKKVEGAWDAAWEGKPFFKRGVQGEESFPLGADDVQQLRGQPAHNSKEKEGVNIAEAGIAVEEEEKDVVVNAQTMSADTEAMRRVPVVADANRATFERMLLLPDMLNDHLPDRYLEALQQL